MDIVQGRYDIGSDMITLRARPCWALLKNILGALGLKELIRIICAF